jgi:hypothetical protein
MTASFHLSVVAEPIVENINQVGFKPQNGAPLTFRPSFTLSTDPRVVGHHELGFDVLLYLDRTTEQTALVSDAACFAPHRDPTRDES